MAQDDVQVQKHVDEAVRAFMELDPEMKALHEKEKRRPFHVLVALLVLALAMFARYVYAT